MSKRTVHPDWSAASTKSRANTRSPIRRAWTATVSRQLGLSATLEFHADRTAALRLTVASRVMPHVRPHALPRDEAWAILARPPAELLTRFDGGWAALLGAQFSTWCWLLESGARRRP